MLSVNQLNAGIKILEMWKALKKDNYPLKVQSQNINAEGINTRVNIAGRPIKIGLSSLRHQGKFTTTPRVEGSNPGQSLSFICFQTRVEKRRSSREET